MVIKQTLPTPWHALLYITWDGKNSKRNKPIVDAVYFVAYVKIWLHFSTIRLFEIFSILVCFFWAILQFIKNEVIKYWLALA